MTQNLAISQAFSSNKRLPKKHGETVAEVIDLGGAVARVERLTFVDSECTYLSILVPAGADYPASSVRIFLSREQLDHFVERLAWPK